MTILNKKELKIFLTFFIIYAIFSDYINWNENSRLDLTMAIVDEGRLEIDSYYNNTGDRAFYKGHYYSDKAPGMSFLAVPIYFAYTQVFGKPHVHQNLHNLNVSRGYLLLMFFVIIFTSSLFGALSVVLVYKISRYFTKKESYRTLLVVTYGLGTLALIYSRLFLGHITATFFSFLCFYLIFKSKIEKKDYGFFAGLAGGFAIFTEYTALVITLGCFVLLCFQKKWKSVLKFCLGASIFLIILLGYHYSVYDKFFITGYDGAFIDQAIWGNNSLRLAMDYRQIGDEDWYYFYEAMGESNEKLCDNITILVLRDRCFRKVAAAKENVSICSYIESKDCFLYCKAMSGADPHLCNDISSFRVRKACSAFVNQKPSLFVFLYDFYTRFKWKWRTQLFVVLELLFIPYRGLFFYSPILLFSFFGLAYMYHKFKAETINIIGIFIILLLFNSGYNFWWGGASFGPRHLTLLMPFLMIPLIFSIKKCKVKFLLPIIILSIMLTSIGLQEVFEPQNFQLSSYSENFEYFWNNFVNLIKQGPQSVLLGKILLHRIHFFPYSTLILVLAFSSLIWHKKFLKLLKIKKSLFLIILCGVILTVLSVNTLVWLKSINFFPLYDEIVLNGDGWHSYEVCDASDGQKKKCSWMEAKGEITIFNAKEGVIPVNLELPIMSLLVEEKNLIITLNNQTLQTLRIRTPNTYSVNLNLTPGHNKLVFVADSCEIPKEIIMSEDTRCLSFFFRNPRIIK